MLRIQLLGGFRLHSGDELITTLTVPRLQSLLAYLVLHRQSPQLRQHLAFLFWPDSTEAQARTNLRHALHNLRLALPDAATYLDIQTQWLQWRPAAPFTLDVAEFEAAHTEAAHLLLTQQEEPALPALVRAVELYRGPLLPGSYEEWVLAKRDELAQRFGQTLAHLLTLLEKRRDYTAAISYAMRLLQHDPLAETTYQHLMRLYALQGNHAGALHIYHECVAMLGRELGVEPSVETRTAYTQLFNEEPGAALPVEQPLRAGDTPLLVGREREWQQLLLLWQNINQGNAQVVAITGEAGIGKTRLAETLVNWVNRQGQRAAGVRAYQAEGALAFAPLIDLLRTETMAPALSDLDEVWLAQVARLLPEVRASHPHLAPVDVTADIGQRQHFYEALAHAILAGDRPLLIILDDLHWCDQETLEWLRFLLRFAPQAKLLLLVTVRTGEASADHPLHSFLLSLRREHRLLELSLSRLTPAHTATLAAQVAGRELDAGQLAELYRQTEGNPLFVVEMVRNAIARWAAGADRTFSAALPAGTAGLATPNVFLPDSVQAVIQARLAQLTPLAQEVAGVTATLGGSFTLDVLAHASGYGEEELVRGLDELWQRHIVREQGSHEYDFSHPHIREVVYRQLSPLRRRLLHRRAAQALEAVYGERIGALAALVAAHYEVAGYAGQAVQAYQRAARFAKQTFAYQEAAGCLRRALTLLQTVPDDDARQQLELELQLELGPILMITKSFADPEVQQVYDRALELCNVTDAGLHLYQAIWGLHEIYMFQANYQKAHIASEQCWQLAQRSGDPELLLQAHHALWFVYFYIYMAPQGLLAVLEHTQQGIELYRPEYRSEGSHSRMHQYGGHDPGVCARFIRAKALWLLGYPDQAAASVEEAVALATRLAEPIDLRLALGQGAKVYAFRLEPQRVLDHFAQMHRLTAEHNLPFRDSEERVWRGWSLAQISPDSQHVTLIRQGIASSLAIGTHLNKPIESCLLAETLLGIGDIAAARQAVEEGLAIAAASGEDYFRPELHRLLGHCLLAAGAVDDAESSFRQALALAQQQKTKSLELRAAISLSRHWAEQGKQAQAYELLAGVYAWFTEGFDTADLRQANELLLALSR